LNLGYSCRSYKRRQFQIANLLEVDFKSKRKKLINILQVVMFQNVFVDPKISKNKQISFFFLFLKISFEIFVSFPKKNKKLNICVFPISYTCLHVISYKCKYVLFHLNMLKLFQEINIFFFFFDIKLASNKNFSFKRLNLHLLS